MTRTKENQAALAHAPKGMTLIEILVVIAIIGIVATVVAVGVVGWLNTAKEESAKTLVNNVSEKIVTYAATYNELPKDLQSLVEKKHIKKAQVRDPWNEELVYNPGNSGQPDDFELCSKGPDKSEGGDDDICNTSDDE